MAMAQSNVSLTVRLGELEKKKKKSVFKNNDFKISVLESRF
jgi:hypothetical protein